MQLVLFINKKYEIVAKSITRVILKLQP